MSDEKMLGNVKFRPMQRDMFTGELSDRPPKRGNGSHIQLKPLGLEKPAIPGMASFAGEGPAGKLCRDCDHYGEVALKRADFSTVEMNRKGCVLASRLRGHASGVNSIEVESACKKFEEETRANRKFIIEPNGDIRRVHLFPEGGAWWPKP